jgi:hypothetical protein
MLEHLTYDDRRLLNWGRKARNSPEPHSQAIRVQLMTISEDLHINDPF